MRDHVDGLGGWIQMEYLPPYAPELNPVEYIWGVLKAACAAQCLPERLLATERRSPTHAAAHAAPSSFDHRLLEAGFSVARMTLYYAGLNKTFSLAVARRTMSYWFRSASIGSIRVARRAGR